MSKLIECLKNPPRQIYATGTPIDMERHYKAWEQSILATLIAEGWVRKDEVLARLPKIGQVDKKSIVLIFGRMFAKGYDAAIEECIAAVKELRGI